MATITLKDIPRSIHMALRQRAKQHGRSLNKETLACLETVVAPTRMNTEALLLDLQRHRASLPGTLTDQLISTARLMGRP